MATRPSFCGPALLGAKAVLLPLHFLSSVRREMLSSFLRNPHHRQLGFYALEVALCVSVVRGGVASAPELNTGTQKRVKHTQAFQSTRCVLSIFISLSLALPSS